MIILLDKVHRATKFTLLLTVLRLGGVAYGQGSVDIIAPIGQVTQYKFQADRGEGALSCSTPGFTGTCTVARESNTGLAIVSVRPDDDPKVADRPPKVFDVKLGTSTVKQLRVYPVRIDSEVADVPSNKRPERMTKHSADYVTISKQQVTSEPNSTFNGARHNSLRQLTISGPEVIIEKTIGETRFVYDQLMPGGNPPEELKAVFIYAQNVVVRSPVDLPGTEVTIYAKTLSFEGPASHLKTTPRPYLNAALAEDQNPKDGAKGQDAGAIHLYLGEKPKVSVNNGREVFVLKGGHRTDGQRG